MIAPFLPLAFHFAQHSKLQHGDLLSGCDAPISYSGLYNMLSAVSIPFSKNFIPGRRADINALRISESGELKFGQ